MQHDNALLLIIDYLLLIVALCSRIELMADNIKSVLLKSN